MKQKRTFRYVFIVFSLVLATLPLMVTAHNALTKIVESLELYTWVQEVVVPWEIKIVGGIMQQLGIAFEGYPEGFRANGHYARLTWNCLGWQSLLFMIISFPIGFSAGRYTHVSKLEAIGIGLLGTFLVNVVRITFTVLLLVFAKKIFAVVFHDYLAAVMTVVWLTVYWWFVYGYVLEERTVARDNLNVEYK